VRYNDSPYQYLIPLVFYCFINDLPYFWLNPVFWLDSVLKLPVTCSNCCLSTEQVIYRLQLLIALISTFIFILTLALLGIIYSQHKNGYGSFESGRHQKSAIDLLQGIIHLEQIYIFTTWQTLE
jgi:hypothetical protein